MKKWVSVMLMLVMGTVVLTGCGNKEGAPTAAGVSKDMTTEQKATAKGDPAKKAILVVSFGTSYNDSRDQTIGAIEKEIRQAYPDYEVRRAFTSQVIIDKLAKRDKLEIDNVSQAMERLAADGYGTVICQPTHVMNGLEYDEMVAAVNVYADRFASITFGKPLLTSARDYQEVATAIIADMPMVTDQDALVLMGHGTEHFADAAYAAMDYVFKDQNKPNFFVGTVEGYPDLPTVMKHVKAKGAEKVYLMPLMVVAGDHATNDMAGDEEDSWKTAFKKEGFAVEPILKGLGENSAVRGIYVAHVAEAIERNKSASAQAK